MVTREGKSGQEGIKTVLNPNQQAAVNHGEGPLLITAGAGSGKTRTLTERIVHLLDSGVPGEKIVAITFTNKAAEEIRDRVLSKLKSRPDLALPFLGTFHSFGAKLLRRGKSVFGRKTPFTIFDEDDSVRLIKKIIKDLNLPVKKYPAAQLKRTISRTKDELADPDDLDPDFKPIFEMYESELERQNAFDFDDLIEKAVRFLKSDRSLLEDHHEAFTHFLVDEFQDVNTGQYTLVKLLASASRNLSVVGDDNQSIFRFRGADFRNFLNFERDWPEAKIVNLGENYRSTQTIVKTAGALIKNNKFQRPKEIWTNNEPGEPIKIIPAADPNEEAELVIDDLLNRGLALEATAVLYRTNAQSRALEQVLNFQSLPYRIYGGLKFYERKEIKDIVAALRAALNPREEVSLERLKKTFRRETFNRVREKLAEASQDQAPSVLINRFLEAADYKNHLKDKFDNYEDRLENINELVSFASNFASLEEFVERLSLLQATDALGKTGSGGLKLMTIHLAKGLEFENVYLVGLTEGLLPHERSLGQKEELEEERRLAYVAMTRAKKRLTLSFFATPSRFLGELPEKLLELHRGPQRRFEDEIYVY